MPKITTQKPTSLPRKIPTNNADDVWGNLDTIRMLLYGQSGTGKTTLWATFPGPILALICSGGNKPGELRSINTPEYRKKITPRIVNSMDDLREGISDASEFRTVVLDHASGLADMVLKEILGLDSIPAQKSWGLASQQQYGQQALQLKEILRTILNLPGNSVIVAQERRFGEESSSVESLTPVVAAALSPAVVSWLNPACDYVVQTFKRPRMIRRVRKIAGKEVVTEERGKGVEYCLRTAPHDIYTTKFRVPKNKELPEVIIDPSYEKIIEILKD